MKKILSLTVFSLLSLTTFAAPVSPRAALKTAKQFFFEKGILFSQAEPAMKAPRTGNASDAYYYVFNADTRGFVVVSGDDRTEQILGYSDTGYIDTDNMPENLQAWLQSYEDQIKWLDENNIDQKPETPVARAMRRASKATHSIAPMLTCNWNQGDPYNLHCPTYYNPDGTSGRSVTGCTQTAFAQVLYWYKYPEVTKKRIPAYSMTYNLDDGTQKKETIPAVKAGTPIRWNDMCDNYYGGETEEQRTAVAELMVLIGQSLHASYGSSTGASFSLAHTLLCDYLGYDDGVYVTDSGEHGIQEWQDLMYDELERGYPIIFCGFSTGGGHAFVLDGFDGDDLFHLNWGWGGGSNGYFRLTVLNPGDNSGIGASSSADGYSMGQSAVLNLRPNDDGIEGGVETKPHMTIDGVEINGTKVKARFINWTGATGSFNGAIVAKNEEGVLTPVSEVKGCENLGANYLYNWEFDLAGRFTKPGTYKLTPASKLKASPEYYPRYNLVSEYIEAVVDDNLAVTLTKIEPFVDLNIDEWKFTGSLKAGEEQNVTVTISNEGDEFKREMALYVSKTEDMGEQQSRSMVCVKEGDTQDFTFFFKPQETGVYNVWLTLNGNQNVVYGQTSVNVTNTAQNSASLKFTSLNTSCVYGGRIKGTATFQNNSSKAFDGTVKLTLWQKNVDDNYCHVIRNCISNIAMSASKTANAEFDFADVEVNRTYFITADVISQSGSITDGGLIWSHSFETKPGLVYWTNTGTVAGSAQATTYSVSASTCALYVNGATFGTVKANSNTNTIYAIAEGTAMPAGLEGTNLVVASQAEEINLSTDKAVAFPVSFTAQRATLSHAFTKACDGEKGYDVITLPFVPQTITIDGTPVALKDGSVFIKEFYMEDDANEVLFADVCGFRSGTPYIIGCGEELVGKSIVFYAENVDFTATDNDFMYVGSEHYGFNGLTVKPRMKDIYILNDEGSAFVLATSNKSVSGGYFTTKFSAERRPEQLLIKITNNPTGINAAHVQDASAVYDLQGRRVVAPQRGIYIQNGRKVVK